MRTLKLTIAYDGTDYGGWQVQPNRNTVQAELERALARTVCERIRTTASGRTDAGVHAEGQVVSFQLESKIPVRPLHRALNSRLPDDIRILDLIDAPSGFHAIRDATRKRYRYRIYNSPILDIFRRKYVWQQKMPLDNQAMAQAIEDVRGELDFACFQSTGSPRKTTVRTMTDVRFEAIPVLDGYELIIELEATGFLYNMARNIVGTLVWIGRGKQPADWIPRLIAEGDRRQAGMTAPAHGLTMLKVWYDNVDFETSPMLASTEELESAKSAGHRLPADD